MNHIYHIYTYIIHIPIIEMWFFVLAHITRAMRRPVSLGHIHKGEEAEKETECAFDTLIGVAYLARGSLVSLTH